VEDNVLDKKLLSFINEKTFTRKKAIKKLQEDIKKFYAINFTLGNINEASNILNNKNLELRRHDAILISLFAGALTVIFLITIFVLFVPG
jgi:hypothetical protein